MVKQTHNKKTHAPAPPPKKNHQKHKAKQKQTNKQMKEVDRNNER